jgi:hypothetical protein
MSKSERRSIQQEFRVSPEGEPTTIGGYAAVFDSPTSIAGLWTEVVDSHAFDNVIGARPDVRSLFNHDPNYVIGRTTAGTLTLSIDARGLAYVATPPTTSWASDLIVSMRRGDITGSSYGYTVARDQWVDNADGSVTRTILEIGELFDASPVTFPAFDAATSTVRSMPTSMPREIRSKIEARADRKDTCGCDCAQCVSGNCNLCNDDDCMDEVCSCANQRSIHTPDAEWRATTDLLLKLAESE